jgi:large subunit ribosomal protein L17
MQHKKSGRKFGRIRKVRKAFIKTLLGSLIIYEKITTTEARAKELKSKIDRLINKGKKAQDKAKKIAVVRELKKYIPEKAISKITGEFIKRFDSRNSGYTRIIKLGGRKSDSAKMAVIEFV